MVGEENGKKKALQLLSSGKAEEKLRQIIEAQGGDPQVKAEDMSVGDKCTEVTAEIGGRVLWVNNSAIAQIARTAGTPNDKKAGLLLNLKMGEKVDKGDILFQIYSSSASRCELAADLAEKLEPIILGSRIGERMVIKQVKRSLPLGTEFILER